MREKYSNSTWFPLFCFLSICWGNPAWGQEALWSHPGLGENPNLSVLLEDGKVTLVLVGSPFRGGVLALDPRDGSQRWVTELTERINRPGRMLTDMALFSTHMGTLIAIDPEDGEEMWRQASDNPEDFAAVSPMVAEGSIYTLTARGVLNRYAVNGERMTSKTVPTEWEGRRAEFVPMWRDATGLSFLDQAGRLRSYDLVSLDNIDEKKIVSAVGPGMDPLGSEVLGGVYSAAQGLVWSTELSGLLRSSQVDSGRTRWTAYVGSPQELYSGDGRSLAVPMLSLPPEQKCLVLTRTRANIFSAETGRVLRVHDLPSPAVAPPLFDLDRRTWWILTEDSLVALEWDGELSSTRLPLLERPYTAALAGANLIVGAASGRVYSMTLPLALPPAPAPPPGAQGEPGELQAGLLRSGSPHASPEFNPFQGGP